MELSSVQLNTNRAQLILTGFYSLVFLALTSCESESKPAQRQSSSQALSAEDGSCRSAADCQAVDFQFKLQPTDGFGLVMLLNQPSDWSISIVNPDPKRRIVMRAYSIPTALNVVGQASATLEIRHSINIPTVGDKPLHIVGRDVTRCEIENPRSKDICNDINALSPQLVPYEKEILVSYRVVAGDSASISDPTFLENRTPSFGKDGGNTACLKGAIPGVLTGLAKGSVFSMILGGAKNCVLGSLKSVTE